MDTRQYQQQILQPGHLGMDPKHRDLILNNIEKLIDETDYKVLLLACMQNRLLNGAMVNKIEAVTISDRSDDETLQRERHRSLFKKLTKRGPNAFQELKNILAINGFNAALRRLSNYVNDHQYMERTPPRITPVIPVQQQVQENVNNVHSEGACISKTDRSDSDDYKLEPYSEEIVPKEALNVIKSTSISTSNKIPVYPMKSQHNRGVLFMVNIINFVNKEDYRKGAKEDSEAMLHLFKELGFTLFYFENLQYKDFYTRLDEVIKSEYVRKTECFVMALMTHGVMDKKNRVEKVEFSDGSVILVSDILERFNNNVCTNLRDKPKIFLFPFCRGHSHDLGHDVQTQADSIGNFARSTRSPTTSDVLICYATLPGYRAYRNSVDGSWYIQCFCKNMAKHAYNTHFEDLLKLIQEEVGKKQSEIGAMQTANYNNLGFNKLLYFNPGIFEEERESG